jgi:uncharacterized membrane protein YhhN
MALSGAVATLLFLTSGSVGVVAAETHRRRWLWWAKPLTTALLFAVIGPGGGGGRFAALVSGGVALSLVGDTALLFESERSFLVGLIAFLGAHVLYAVGFFGKARGSMGVFLYALVMLLATGALLRRLWRGAGGMRGPVVVYGAAIATMAITAFATMGGGGLSPAASRLAAAGALLFVISDSCLALSRFSRPIPHSAVLTLGVYWLGQLGIAWAARLG